MRVKRENLYDIVFQMCDGEYSIGMHGVDPYQLSRFYPEKSVPQALDSIMEEGISIKNHRTIHGTVRFFGRIDTEEDQERVRDGLENYRYGNRGYAIVAIPTIFRNQNNEELFLGSPKADGKYTAGTTGYQESCFIEDVFFKGTIPSEFIFGYALENEDGTVDLKINPNRTLGIVSDSMYSYALRQAQLSLFFTGINLSILKKDLSDEERKILTEKLYEYEERLKESPDNIDYAKLCGVISQVLEEKDKKKLPRPERWKYDPEIFEKDDITVTHEQSGPVVAELKYGEYVAGGTCYYMEFSYKNKAQKNMVFSLFNDSLIPNYGTISDRFKRHESTIYPYLVDRHGNPTADPVEIDAVGGVDLPDDIRALVIKDIVEAGIQCRAGDVVMDGRFDPETYEALERNATNTQSVNKERQI